MIGKTKTVRCPRCGESTVYMVDFTQEDDTILIFWGCGSCIHEWETHEKMQPHHYDFFGIPRPDESEV